MKLFFAIYALILLFGCAATMPEAPPVKQYGHADTNASTATVERTGTVAQPQEAVPQEQPKPGYTCAITLSPETIYAGDATEIIYNVYSPKTTLFTFNCGDEIRTISSGGLVTGSRLCNFMSPGSIAVWIKADGKTCIEKTLTVKERETIAKHCSIDEKTIERRLSDHYYSATVFFYGFNETDSVEWRCGGIRANTTVGFGAFGGPAPSKYMYMDFAQKPPCDAIAVTVGGIPCGSINVN
jgi:hypothetical protein